MTVEWVQAVPNAKDKKRIQGMLDATNGATVEGGGESVKPTFELLNHAGHTPVRGGTLQDAVAHFVDAVRREPHPPTTRQPMSFIPGLVDIVKKNVGCACATPTCTSKNLCKKASVARGEKFQRAYFDHEARGKEPLTLTVRATNDTTPHTHSFRVTFRPTENPSFEEVRHGLIGRMRVSAL